jgi:S-methylmethionine-dependent homocysteine/selenocysteine methylase
VYCWPRNITGKVLTCLIYKTLYGSKYAACAAGKALWISFTLEDTLGHRLRSQQPLEEAVQQLLSHYSHIQAVMVNCCAPAAVDAAMPILVDVVPQGEGPKLASMKGQIVDIQKSSPARFEVCCGG